jgi:protein tyrosine/serine phosphatase
MTPPPPPSKARPPPRRPFDLTYGSGRRRALLSFLQKDHAYLRAAFQNAHWLDARLVRTNQPWPFQIRRWSRRGIRTIVNLRGGFDGAFYAIERDACEKAGLRLVDFTVTSRDIPSAETIEGVKTLFETIDYPALIHCKSGADRAGLMSALYAHFQLGQPIEQARSQLSLRYLHLKSGRTGILDHLFDSYLIEGRPAGYSFIDWVRSPGYDPNRLKADFRPRWWGQLLADRLLRRE